MKDLSKYLPRGYQPFSVPASKLYPDAMAELAKPFPSVKLKHFPKFNHLTGGLRPYEFTILCGSTGTGKTTLCANLSRDLIDQGIPHYVASVETGANDFMKRVISTIAGSDWNQGDPIPIDSLKRFHVNHGSVIATPHLQLSLFDNRFSVEILMAELTWHIQNNQIKVAIIDNLNFFLEVTSAANQVIEMDRVIHELIIFCKRANVHLIMVMHPKKTDGRVESEFDVKGSSTAVQEAHNVLLFNRPHPDLIEKGIATPDDRELMLAKMRRKGKWIRKRLILKSFDGVSYCEGEIV